MRVSTINIKTVHIVFNKLEENLTIGNLNILSIRIIHSGLGFKYHNMGLLEKNDL